MGVKVGKPRFVRREREIEIGRFAEAVQAAMDQKGMTMVELSEELGVSYEHIRKLLNAMAFPSSVLLSRICGILGMDTEETERILVAERIRRKYGNPPDLPEPHPRNQRVTKIERKLPSLTDEQLKTLTQLIDTMLKANQTPG